MTGRTTCKRYPTGRSLADHDLDVDNVDISIGSMELRSGKGMGVVGLVEGGGWRLEVGGWRWR